MGGEADHASNRDSFLPSFTQSAFTQLRFYSANAFIFALLAFLSESEMTSIAGSLAASLPKPKYTGEEEEVPIQAQQRGPRIVGPGQLDESQIVLRVNHQSLFYTLPRAS